jgi:hypothetical protein
LHRSPFVVAPEYKVTDLHGETGQLVGAWAGKLVDGVLFVGGAGYWMVDASRDTDIGYGGLVVAWNGRAQHLVGYSLRGLADSAPRRRRSASLARLAMGGTTLRRGTASAGCSGTSSSPSWRPTSC